MYHRDGQTDSHGSGIQPAVSYPLLFDTLSQTEPSHEKKTPAAPQVARYRSAFPARLSLRGLTRGAARTGLR
ncbi:hypothetical protein EYF80_010944 [Liparis tanakae]|uniref:Uncharacterized protein n=1 Tax=Liparis tanakae TaxID=230148 RepID=A0A4Z2IMR4_9TELE|nr:hypothetical protein EYF80_010944 [Liparis tanakae]